MSVDLRERLHDVAPRPARPLDVDALYLRGRRHRRRRLTVRSTVAVMVAAGALAGAFELVPRRAVPVIANTFDPHDAVADGPVIDSEPPADAPSDLLLAILVPASGADMRRVAELRHLDNRVIQQRFTDCMSEQGFDLSFMRSDPADRTGLHYHFPNPASLEKYGFTDDELSWRSPGEAVLFEAENIVSGRDNKGKATMSAAFAEALVDSHRECGADIGESPPALEQFWEDHSALHDGWMNRMIAAERDSEALADAWDRWAACMAGHSWDVDSQDDFFGQLDGLMMRTLNDGDESARRRLELDAGPDYVDCLPIVEEARQPLRDQERQEYIDENYASLLEAEARLREVLPEIGHQ